MPENHKTFGGLENLAYSPDPVVLLHIPATLSPAADSDSDNFVTLDLNKVIFDIFKHF